MKRLYVVPVEATTGRRSAKYFPAPKKAGLAALAGVVYRAFELDADRAAMVVCADTTLVQHTALLNQPDVTLWRDQDLTEGRTTLLSRIEAAQPALASVSPLRLFDIDLRTATRVG